VTPKKVEAPVLIRDVRLLDGRGLVEGRRDVEIRDGRHRSDSDCRAPGLCEKKFMPPWRLGISLAAVLPRSPADRVLKRGQWQALLCDGNVTRSVLQTARPS
jgi:hypothetical protein